MRKRNVTLYDDGHGSHDGDVLIKKWVTFSPSGAAKTAISTTWRNDMGSSGSGRFSDYPGTKPTEVTGDGVGMEGGASGVDRCKQAFHVVLEDVGNSDFYSQFRNVPDKDAQLGIAFDNKRVFAVDASNVKVGALPTSFNYLVACLADGIVYTGVVTFSSESPVPTVSADFVPK